MSIPKGGRGKRAPYDTCTVRIPAAIRDEVDSLAERYRASVLEGSEFIASGSTSLSDALVEARKILAQKRSAKQSIIKLLQVIYKQKISEIDLE